MKKINKKGFTIVELVIVIAVIAILAAVLIPTFSGVVSNANASAAQQEAKTALTNALAMSSNASLPANTVFVIDYDGKDSDTDLKPDYRFDYNGNKLVATTIKNGSNYIKLEPISYNRLIISDKSISGNGNALTKMVENIIITMFGATSVSFDSTNANANGYYVVTIIVGNNSYKLNTYTCGDYETNIVTFVAGTNVPVASPSNP